ncbi:MAG: hypothetical protein QGG40_09025 [Myxococcota bacterium]|nr:hypothetical protein [Myxococcota bacterium]
MSESSTEIWADEAEEIRAYLVSLRGGAPFLSSADSRLLLAWLESGVGLPLILTCLDRVAERRRARRVRARLSLHACRGEIKRALKRGERLGGSEQSMSRPEPETRERASSPGLCSLAEEIGALDWPEVLVEPRQTLVHELLALAGRAQEDLEQTAGAAIGACRRFQEQAWERLSHERPALLEQARGEIVDLRDALGEERFEQAVEEVARDRLRARFPQVSAGTVWDRLQVQAAL